VASEFGAPDLVIEATGYSPLAWKAAEVLDLNGVVCLLSVTGGDETVEIPSDALNREFVLGNRLLFGAVNAHRSDFERGLADLRAVEEQWPGVLHTFITRRLPIQCVREALDGKDRGELKTVIQVSRDT
jgi:threonine dehydrogenase-like Zn-dependent dehydrogenase